MEACGSGCVVQARTGKVVALRGVIRASAVGVAGRSAAGRESDRALLSLLTSMWVGGVEGGVHAAALSVHFVTAARTVSRERHSAGSLGEPTLAQTQSQYGVFGPRLFASAETWRFGMIFPRNLRGGVKCTGLDGQAVQALQSVARGGTVLLA